MRKTILSEDDITTIISKYNSGHPIRELEGSYHVDRRRLRAIMVERGVKFRHPNGCTEVNEDDICDYYKNCQSIKDTASYFHISSYRCKNILLSHNVQLKDYTNSFSDESINKILEMYATGRYSIKTIAKTYKTSASRISNLLKDNGFEVLSATRKTDKRLEDLKRRKENNSIKYETPVGSYKCTKEIMVKNMEAHITYNVPDLWFMQFEDIDKVKILNNCLARSVMTRKISDLEYMKYILTFYDDINFNTLYNKYIESGFVEWYRPSLDHIVPKSFGGKDEVANFQFVSQLENRIRCNIPINIWVKLRKNISDYIIGDVRLEGEI